MELKAKWLLAALVSGSVVLGGCSQQQSVGSQQVSGSQQLTGQQTAPAACPPCEQAKTVAPPPAKPVAPPTVTRPVPPRPVVRPVPRPVMPKVKAKGHYKGPVPAGAAMEKYKG